MCQVAEGLAQIAQGFAGLEGSLRDMTKRQQIKDLTGGATDDPDVARLILEQKRQGVSEQYYGTESDLNRAQIEKIQAAMQQPQGRSAGGGRSGGGHTTSSTALTDILAGGNPEALLNFTTSKESRLPSAYEGIATNTALSAIQDVLSRKQAASEGFTSKFIPEGSATEQSLMSPNINLVDRYASGIDQQKSLRNLQLQKLMEALQGQPSEEAAPPSSTGNVRFRILP